jgi:hypothetical protein
MAKRKVIITDDFQVGDELVPVEQTITDDALDAFRQDVEDATLGFRSRYADIDDVCLSADGVFHTYF